MFQMEYIILHFTGDGITPSDIVGNKLTGEFVIQDNEAKITVGIVMINSRR